jgi:cell wall-associated NlpC family hydrolase
MPIKRVFYLFIVLVVACVRPHNTEDGPPRLVNISTGNILPSEVIWYAQSLKGVPYKYGSIDPAQGFDCSGFITYVFNHFGINVPRTSVNFTFAGHEVDLKDARAGDLILFTGTDTTGHIVGHMGIVLTHQGGEIKFIHSTSGKNYGITETLLNAYYKVRYVKTIRVFLHNDLLASNE